MLKGPKPTQEVLSPATETVSAAPNVPNRLEAYSPDRADHPELPSCDDVPQNANAGHTNHVQFVPRGNAHHVRTRKPNKKVTLGSHVTSQPAQPKLDSHSPDVEAGKVNLFTRGGQDRLPRRGVSDRSFNSQGQDAPNTKKA